MDEIGSVCYDKAQISTHPTVLHYRDDTIRYMFASLAGYGSEVLSMRTAKEKE